MNLPSTGARPRHRARLPLARLIGVVALVAVGLVLLVQGVGSGSVGDLAVPRPPRAAVTTAQDVAGVADVGDTARPPTAVAAAPALPRRVRIDRIGVSSSIVGLGLQDDGTVEVPDRPEQVGWFSLGPTPGSVGSSVLLGHVDSVDGPAVFARLAELRPGDRVEVDLQGGRTEVFEVRQVASYPNQDFPADRVYAGEDDRAALNLVTCGGEYDAARGGYQSNVVVYTRRVPA
ncbi:class F sortase [Nocardioides plantarum]|uniref:Class F sortase n=1 Tax=Nocardioides plantarum TaxID=29299 RepID=A0ABV5KB49_9ACTN|nr:class F sortase [Nocardioides plantarum]